VENEHGLRVVTEREGVPDDVLEKEPQHDDVGSILHPLLLEDAELLVRTVAADAQIEHLGHVQLALQLDGPDVLVARVLAEREGVAQDDDAQDSGPTGVRVVAQGPPTLRVRGDGRMVALLVVLEVRLDGPPKEWMVLIDAVGRLQALAWRFNQACFHSSPLLTRVIAGDTPAMAQ
jgi:hypothetical protein